jgi:hypothetical protein
MSREELLSVIPGLSLAFALASLLAGAVAF